MQVTREERVAKAKGLGILALMAAVALAVHVWPRPEPRPARAADVTLRAPTATAPVAAVRAEPDRRPLRAPARVVRPAAAAPVPAPPALPARPGDSVGTVTLAALPGSAVAPPGPPTVQAKDRGAVTRAAQATGKGLAGAFRKTGAAFRRAF